ncbi:chemotaxis protein CheW [Pseudomonas alcaligenes]|uniref:Chemotaxis protein CheW n=1 Tax=Aquipseudomonas alcaligenes TaxID=43263 RepID=A0ABR7S0Y6_AQUAC|nr:CheW domain-containing protein [Pseudomonas alcaligenes]MBC9250455.1 chemotaxis protein CheW [Pseudomonas alcaligenes]
MSRSASTATRSQLALQSYLDALLQEAAAELEQSTALETVELEQSVELDEFEAAVLEEQVRDSRREVPQVAPLSVRERPLALAEAKPLVLPTIELNIPEVREEPRPLVPVEVQVEVPVAPPVVEALVELQPALKKEPVRVGADGRPDWAQESFECLLFDVAGLTLAVPLVCLGSIYPLAGTELTPLFGQPDWFLGILPCQAGNLKVLDTARWVMPERYREDFREGLQYVISVEGYEWGLAVHQVSRSIRLQPDEIKWRSQRSQRPWLAGTVIEHMCALLDVSALAELIASGATRNAKPAKPARAH